MSNLPYSPIVKHNDMLYVSGQLPLKNGNLLVDVHDASIQCLLNIEKLLLEQGSSLEKVVKVTVFMTDLSKFETMNVAYSSIFVNNKPARSAIEVNRLPKGAIIEIECIAYV